MNNVGYCIARDGRGHTLVRTKAGSLTEALRKSKAWFTEQEFTAWIDARICDATWFFDPACLELYDLLGEPYPLVQPYDKFAARAEAEGLQKIP